MDPIQIFTQPGFVDQFLIPWTVRIITAAIIWYVGKWVATHLTGMIRKLMTRARVDVMLVQFLGTIIHTVLLVVVVIAALDHLGVPTTSMIAVFGAAGLAIGLALKDSLANFAAGIMLILFRPFRVGDFIEAGGVSGVPEEIRIFSTVMRTPDNRIIVVPNGQIANGVIVNYNAKPTRRIDLVVGVSYGDNLAKVKQIIEQVLRDEPRVLTDPEPLVAVADLAESSVNINVRPWVNTDDFWPVRADLLERIKTEFDREGITIPFPQREMWVRDGSGASIHKATAPASSQ